MTVDNRRGGDGAARARKFPEFQRRQAPVDAPILPPLAPMTRTQHFDLAEKNKSKLDGSMRPADEAEPEALPQQIRDPYLHAEKCADFYMEVFELEPTNKEDLGPWLSPHRWARDAVDLPWSIPVFEGMSIKRPGPTISASRSRASTPSSKDIADVTGAAAIWAVSMGGGGSPTCARRCGEKRDRKSFSSTDRAGFGSTSPTSRRLPAEAERNAPVIRPLAGIQDSSAARA